MPSRASARNRDAQWRLCSAMSYDRPRLLRDQEQIRLRRSELNKPHIKPLALFAERLRNQSYGQVPDFDPRDGGNQAKALFLFEKPGPQAFASGFVSRNNDDRTAENTFRFMEEAHIPREMTCLWNVVPGWNGTTRLTRDELKRGGLALRKLLDYLANLKVVVLVGKRAYRAWSQLDDPPNLPTIQSAHPSPVVYATARAAWNAIPTQWAIVRKHFKCPEC